MAIVSEFRKLVVLLPVYIGHLLQVTILLPLYVSRLEVEEFSYLCVCVCVCVCMPLLQVEVFSVWVAPPTGDRDSC